MFRKMFSMFKKQKEEGQKLEFSNKRQTLFDRDAFEKLHVDLGLRWAFEDRVPMSRERYEGLYFHGSGPGAYFIPPSYEEYLRLFEKYQNIIRERKNWSDYYGTHLS